MSHAFMILGQRSNKEFGVGTIITSRNIKKIVSGQMKINRSAFNFSRDIFREVAAENNIDLPSTFVRMQSYSKEAMKDFRNNRWDKVAIFEPLGKTIYVGAGHLDYYSFCETNNVRRLLNTVDIRKNAKEFLLLSPDSNMPLNIICEKWRRVR